jgi:hypothetical protein
MKTNLYGTQLQDIEATLTAQQLSIPPNSLYSCSGMSFADVQEQFSPHWHSFGVEKPVVSACKEPSFAFQKT